MECDLAGLCGGRLRGPSILLDIIEWGLSLAPKTPFEIVPFEVVAAAKDDAVVVVVPINERDMWFVCSGRPGVLDDDRSAFGDEGALPTQFWFYVI